jgi:hypothetical protein
VRVRSRVSAIRTIFNQAPPACQQKTRLIPDVPQPKTGKNQAHFRENGWIFRNRIAENARWHDLLSALSLHREIHHTIASRKNQIPAGCGGTGGDPIV